MRVGAIALVAVLTVIVATGRVAAQESPAEKRSGFWVSGGRGAGLNASRGLDGERLWGSAGYLRLGGTLSPHFRLAGDIAVWTDDVDLGEFVGDDELIRGTILASLSWYPWLERRISFRVGLGLAALETREPVTVHGIEVDQEDVAGFGSNLGFSYDLPLGETLQITPNLDWYFQAFDAPPESSGTNHILMITIGVTTY